MHDKSSCFGLQDALCTHSHHLQDYTIGPILCHLHHGFLRSHCCSCIASGGDIFLLTLTHIALQLLLIL